MRLGDLRLGLGASRYSAPAPPVIATITPGVSWNGTAGSGGTPPTDPMRTVAKPILRIITPPNQTCVSTLKVGFVAAANDNGSLMKTMGIASVDITYEGNTLSILAPTLETITDANGVDRTYYAYWVTLARNDATNGMANLSATAKARNVLFQDRVLTYQFRVNTTEYDGALTIDSTQAQITGSRYQTFAAAGAYAVAQGWKNPHITITGGTSYTLGSVGSVYQGDGYLTLDATVPVEIEFASYTTDAAALMRPRWDGIRFKGSNITIDFLNIQVIYHEDSVRQHWFDGCTITNSGGRYSLWREGRKGSVIGYLCRNNPWFTETVVNNNGNVCVNASLCRGVAVSNCYGDVFTDARCVVDCVANDVDSTAYASDVLAMTVAYSGVEATASIACSGVADASSKVFTAKWGANSATFTVGNTEAMRKANTYLFSQVAAWINGLAAGWLATVIDNTRRASSVSLLAGQGVAFGDTNVKSTTLDLYSMFDVHADLVQQNTAGLLENGYYANIKTTGMIGQNIFVTGGSGAKDFFFGNIATHNKPGDSAYDSNANLISQLGGAAHSHVMVVHCTNSSQGLRFNTPAYNPDAYCLVANNSVRTLVWVGSPDADLTISDNHLQSIGSKPSGSTGTTIGGDEASLYADAANRDFTPAGALLSNLKTPVLARDINGVLRAGSDAAGAWAA